MSIEKTDQVFSVAPVFYFNFSSFIFMLFIDVLPNFSVEKRFTLEKYAVSNGTSHKIGRYM